MTVQVNSTSAWNFPKRLISGGIQGKVQECVEIVYRGIDVLIALIGSESSLEAMLKGPEALSSENWTGTLLSMSKH